MAEALIVDWMEEFESLTESEIHTYSTEQEHNQEVMTAIYDVLAEPYRCKGENLVDGICRQLFEFYRSGEKQLKKFALQYIPPLVFLHLVEKSYVAVQTLLVSIYNLEIIDLNGQPSTVSFRIPSIIQSSIYHDSTNLEPTFFAKNSPRRWEECNSKLVSWGPLPQVESINAQNRQRVATALLFLYNQQLVSVTLQGIEHTCRAISRLVSQGFHTTGSARSSIHSDTSCTQGLTPRVPISSPLLVELLHVTYHAADRGVPGAMQALRDILRRAAYESYADVLLCGNAIENLLHNSPSISITARPSQTQTVAKSMITNASFRTKKLPDDIPIQDEHQTDVPLDSITEEHEDVDRGKTRGSVSALKHLPKLPGLGKKHKSKTHDVVEMSGTMGGGDPSLETSIGEHPLHVSTV